MEKHFDMEEIAERFSSRLPNIDIRFNNPSPNWDTTFDMEKVVKKLTIFATKKPVTIGLAFTISASATIGTTLPIMHTMLVKSSQSQAIISGTRASESCLDTSPFVRGENTIREYCDKKLKAASSSAILSSSGDDSSNTLDSSLDSSSENESDSSYIELPEQTIPDYGLEGEIVEASVDTSHEDSICPDVYDKTQYELLLVMSLAEHELSPNPNLWAGSYDMTYMTEAIAATVDNRVHDSRFANTIEGVINEGYMPSWELVYPVYNDEGEIVGYKSYMDFYDEAFTRSCCEAVLYGYGAYYFPSNMFFEGSLEGCNAYAYNDVWYTTAWGSSIAFGCSYD